MKKEIIFPANVDLSQNSSIWKLLHSREFSRLRCGFARDLSASEIEFLRDGFEPFCGLTSSPTKKFVEANEEISIEMMEEASYELTRIEVSKK